MFYYCDYFEGTEATISEISEPDWCEYHVKVVTKYMCGKWASHFHKSQELTYEEKNDPGKVSCYTRRLKNENTASSDNKGSIHLERIIYE